MGGGQMADAINAASPIWMRIIISITILGGMLLGGGILLAVVGDAEQTTLDLFGNKLSSTSVGVTLAFIGAVMVVVSIRRVLSSLDEILRSIQPDDVKQ